VVGWQEIGASLMGAEPARTGSGVLATITFNLTAAPPPDGVLSCILEAEDTGFLDDNLEDCELTIAHGYYEFATPEPPPPSVKLYVHPSSITDPTLVPNETFIINITIVEVENLYGYEFTLGYNTSVLDCTDVTVHAIQDETNFTPDYSIDDVAGIIWVNVTYVSPAEPITSYPPATMVSITFQVIASGESILDLYDTNLIEQLGEPILHGVSDGYFSNMAIRDLAIVDVILSRTQAYEKFRNIESIIDITVIVRNEGDMTETFDLSTYYDDTLIETQAITDLDPDTNATVTFNWDTTNLPLYINYTIKAVAHEVPEEISTDNNVYFDGPVIIVMFGDTNCDKKVDISDVAFGAKAFGSYIGHERWNPNTDLNNDDVINVIDIVLIAMNFGRTF